MKTATDVLSAPQKHSRDYLIRVKTSDLAGILFEHLYSLQEPSIAFEPQAVQVMNAGTTEWQGMHLGCAVSLSWDWGIDGAGALISLGCVPPRTNLKIIDRLGYDMHDEAAVPLLWARIDALPWQDVVSRGLGPGAIASRH